MNKWLILFFFIGKVSCTLANTVHLVATSWVPYSGEKMLGQGAFIVLAKAAFKSQGHELIVDFYPWSRSLKLANKADSKYIGYIPAYISDTQHFIFSLPSSSSPLALIQSVHAPINFKTVDDLRGIKLGVVQDYANTIKLDAMIARGEINAKPVLRDDMNIKKVASGRIDAAVIDANVFKYLIHNTPDLLPYINQIELNPKMLEDKTLHIAFRDNSEGRKWLKIYNAGLNEIDINALMSDYLKHHMPL